jgi:aryl-alcohol dehydrogenase-like predicted oxidoreductase
MRRLTLRGTNLELSAVCLGAAGFGVKLTEEQAFEILDAFTGAGGNFIDTANVYCRWVPGKANCSEEILGKWLKSRNAQRSVVVATKGGHYDFDNPRISRVNRDEIRKDLDDSLITLKLDQIGFYWLHRDDESKPIEEIIDIMEAFVKEGKIRYYGASNYKLERMKAAKAYADSKNILGFSAVSNQWSLASPNPGTNINPDPTLAFMTDEYYRWHTETLTPMIPYSSTAFGFFEKLKKAGGDFVKLPEDLRKAYANGRNMRVYNDLTALSEELNVSVHALSLACLARQPFDVIPVNSVTNPGQLRDIIQAGGLDLTGIDIIKREGAV